MTENSPRMAICYDFDKTLSPDDMQTFTLIPSFGIDKDKFWAETDAFARENSMESNLSWMFMLVRYSRFLGKSLKREYFRAIGAQVEAVPRRYGSVHAHDSVCCAARHRARTLHHFFGS